MGLFRWAVSMEEGKKPLWLQQQKTEYSSSACKNQESPCHSRAARAQPTGMDRDCESSAQNLRGSATFDGFRLLTHP
jgi:hypothetical protein